MHRAVLREDAIPIVTLLQSELQAFKDYGDRLVEWITSAQAQTAIDFWSVVGKFSGDFTPESRGSLFVRYLEQKGKSNSTEMSGLDCDVALINYPQYDAMTERCSPFQNVLKRNGCSAFMQNILNATDMLVWVKALRRHIFKRFIKRHRKYFKTLLSLLPVESRNLSAESRCNSASAYCVWLALEYGAPGISEYSNMRASNLFFEAHAGQAYTRQQAASYIIDSYITFFDIWGALETANDGGRRFFHIVVHDASVSHSKFTLNNASFTVAKRGDAGVPSQKVQSFIISPDYLSQLAAVNHGTKCRLFLNYTGGDLFNDRPRELLRFVDTDSTDKPVLTINI
nr:hypothetical protein [uncultured Pseudomonas sp.]